MVGNRNREKAKNLNEILGLPVYNVVDEQREESGVAYLSHYIIWNNKN